VLVAVESIIDSRNSGTPHQDDNTKVVELVTKSGDAFAVIRYYVKTGLFSFGNGIDCQFIGALRCRKEEANCYAKEEG